MIFCPLGYRLVIICANEGEEKSHYISKLHAHQQQYTSMYTIDDFCTYLKSKFTTLPAQKLFKGKSACIVDHERYFIIIDYSWHFVDYERFCSQFLCESCEIETFWNGKIFVYQKNG